MTELRIERQDRLEVWTLARESARNALSRALVSELKAQVERVSADRSLSAVVLTGAGAQAFCAGADLKERAGMTEEEVRQFLGNLREALRGIERSERVFIAAVNGAALGGGTELALACDLRVAWNGATFGLTEVTLGIIPGGGGTQRLARLVGPGRAKDLILTGRRVGAEEARQIGLVEHLAGEEGALPAALEIARKIAANAPLALGAAKRAIDDGLALPLDEGLALEHRHYERVLASEDRLEGLAAFREKRAPRFTGR